KFGTKWKEQAKMSKIRKYTSLIRLQLIFSFALLYTINQPLNCDITCLRLQHRFVCLRVFVDWFRRYVLSRAVSGTWNINFLSGSRAVRVATPETCKSEQDM